MKTVAFFNTVGGVGKTTLAYHLGWALADLGKKVVVVDCDPQAGLTCLSVYGGCNYLDYTRHLSGNFTLASACRPVLMGTGDVDDVYIVDNESNFAFVPSSPELTSYYDILSLSWVGFLADIPRDAVALTALARGVRRAGEGFGADFVLLDLPPHLDPIARAMLIGADAVVIPTTVDDRGLYSLKAAGRALRDLRSRVAGKEVELPGGTFTLGEMVPVGYILNFLQTDRGIPVAPQYARLEELEQAYTAEVLAEEPAKADDGHCLGMVKAMTLIANSQQAHKPVFHLDAEDGAVGSLAAAARQAGIDFRAMAERLTQRIGVPLS